MLEKFLDTLSAELATPPFKELEQGKLFAFLVAPTIEVTLTDLQPGVAMSAIIDVCSNNRKEELFIYLMRANLLGQGTGESRLGLETNEKHLTLSLGLPYEMDYRVFKERFEEFVNHLIYWRKELTEFEHKQSAH